MFAPSKTGKDGSLARSLLKQKRLNKGYKTK